MRRKADLSRHFSSLAVWCIFFSILIAPSNLIGQTTYYVSAAGSDANTGKSTSTPWKSIAKLNTVSFTSGDAILFRCGDEFQGQISLGQSGVTLGSYGSGNKPIISGAQHLTGWTRTGSYYVTTASGTVKNLFANSVQMILARYPNSGFVSIGSGSSTTLTASAINQASGYWAGANFRGRTREWVFENSVVTSSSGTSITLASAPTYGLNAGWGFYLDNVLAALDAPGEWYCDPSTHAVYFYAPGGVDPSTLDVEGSLLDYGVTTSQNNITVQGLEFRCQMQAALRFGGSASNIRILSNDIFGGYMHGILFDGSSTNCTIDGNTIRNVNGRGIHFESPANCVVSNNTISDIGLIEGYGISACDGMIGICMYYGTNNIISGNIIDSVGYVGITMELGSYNVVESNVITNVMLRLADGGAVYAYEGFGHTIRNNIVQNSVGGTGGLPSGSYLDAHGIYLDGPDNNHNTVIEGNTIMRAGSAGIYIQYGSYGHTIRNNTLYDCGSLPGGYFFDIQVDGSMNYGQHVIRKNILYPGTATQTLIRVQENSGSVFHSLGSIDSNYYCNPYGNSTPFYILIGSYNKYSFAQWQAVTGQEVHSQTGSRSLSGQDAGSTGSTKPSSSQTNQAQIFVNSTPLSKAVNLGSQSFRDLDGNPVAGTLILTPYSSKILVKDTSAVAKATSVSTQSENVPKQFALFQNYPNPFNPSTVIKYALPTEANVRLEVYDVSGRRVPLLVDETQQAGYHEIRFDGSGFASGVYFYRLQAGAFASTRKLVLLK